MLKCNNCVSNNTAFGQLILGLFYCRYNVACIACVSSFSRLNKQCCVPRILQKPATEKSIFCCRKLGVLVIHCSTVDWWVCQLSCW